MFHPIGGLTQQERETHNTKVFDGNGTPFLKVPGLVRVEAVRVNAMDLPLQRVVEYRTDAAEGSAAERMTLPLVVVDRDEDGTPVLLRSMLSNDGIWQDGAKVYVTGEWDGGAEEVPELVPAGGRGRRG
jgi:hypothetical protein